MKDDVDELDDTLCPVSTLSFLSLYFWNKSALSFFPLSLSLSLIVGTMQSSQFFRDVQIQICIALQQEAYLLLMFIIFNSSGNHVYLVLLQCLMVLGLFSSILVTKLVKWGGNLWKALRRQHVLLLEAVMIRYDFKN